MSRSDFPPLDKSFTGTLQDISERIDRQARRRQRLVVPVRGTTAERDAIYPPPGASVPAQVALANQQIVWWNTELGWFESYYAVSGASGLTVRGLMSLAPAGWYPTGRGPRAISFALGPQSLTPGFGFTNWQAFGLGLSSKNHAGFTLGGGAMSTPFAGRWRAQSDMQFPNGSGGAHMTLYVRDASTAAILQRIDLVTLAGGGYPTRTWTVNDVPMPAGGTIIMHNNDGSWAPGSPNSYLSLEYLGPALVSA